MNRTAQYLLLVIVMTGAIAIAATPPTNLSIKGVADWAIIGGHISSGTGTLPAVGAAGERYTDLSTPTAPVEYRSDGSAWQTISGGGTDDGTAASLSAHISDQTDPHGASMTVSESIAVGTGDAEDAYISRLATGVVMIASYSYLPPTSATPSADIATGTIWYDSNVNKLKCYDGSAWQDLW